MARKKAWSSYVVSRARELTKLAQEPATLTRIETRWALVRTAKNGKRSLVLLNRHTWLFRRLRQAELEASHRHRHEVVKVRVTIEEV